MTEELQKEIMDWMQKDIDIKRIMIWELLDEQAKQAFPELDTLAQFEMARIKYKILREKVEKEYAKKSGLYSGRDQSTE